VHGGILHGIFGIQDAFGMHGVMGMQGIFGMHGAIGMHGAHGGGAMQFLRINSAIKLF